MKKLLFICLLILSACNYTGEELTDENGKKHVFIEYNQKINEYEVSAICFLGKHHEEGFYGGYNPNAIRGRGFLYFKSDKGEFVVENPYYSDTILSNNKQTLEKGMTLKVDYTPFKEVEEFSFSGNDSPFFFYDVDFDDKEELIVCLWEGMDYRGHHAYKAYDIDKIGNNLVLNEKQGAPFDELNDYTVINPFEKTITIPHGMALKYGGEKIYGLVEQYEFNCNTLTNDKVQKFELTSFLKYDWAHTEGIKYTACNPTIYHYKRVGEKLVLDIIEKCENDK